MNLTKDGTLEQLKALNIARGTLFADFHYFQEKNVLYYANAMAGETGEFCNLLKKLLKGERFDRDGKTELTPEYICKELADIIIYADFIAQIYNLSLPEILADKFNEISEKVRSGLFIKHSKL